MLNNTNDILDEIRCKGLATLEAFFQAIRNTCEILELYNTRKKNDSNSKNDIFLERYVDVT